MCDSFLRMKILLGMVLLVGAACGAEKGYVPVDNALKPWESTYVDDAPPAEETAPTPAAATPPAPAKSGTLHLHLRPLTRVAQAR